MQARRFASATEVAISKSKAAIEALLVRHGARDFASGWNATHDTLQFTMKNQTIRFVLPRVNEKDYRVSPAGRTRRPQALTKAIEQANKQRWRALLLVLRAKIEAVEAGIAIFEQEFLAFVVQPNGMTIGDVLVPMLADGGNVQRLIGDGR
jgi:hypothetical protein